MPGQLQSAIVFECFRSLLDYPATSNQKPGFQRAVREFEIFVQNSREKATAFPGRIHKVPLLKG